MDDSAVGVIAWVIIGVVGLVGALGATGGILYATDFALEATIIDKDCGGSGGSGPLRVLEAPEVSVETKLFGISHTIQDIPIEQCSTVQVGNFVKYHVRSERTIIYENEGGKCIYDSHPEWPVVCGA